MSHPRCTLITGANDGIGKATAITLARKGHSLILVARNQQKGESALEEIKSHSEHKQVFLEIADLASQAQTHRLADRILANYPHLNILINNAGVFLNERRLSEDGIEMTFAVNHLAYFLLTNLLLARLKENAPARIINVASMAHSGAHISFEDLNYESSYTGFRAYSESKLANILFTYALARRLGDSSVTVNALHPGVINTKLLKAGWGGVGNPSMEKGAALSVYLADSELVAGVSGKYFSGMKQSQSSGISYDKDLQEKLWKISAELVGLK